MALIQDPSKDPFGQAMQDYLLTGRNRRIRVESDIAIDDIIPVAYLFRDEAEMPAWELMALDACQGKTLDIGAGAGSHSLALQARGIAVVAMDISPGAVAAMRQRGLSTVWHGDFFTFPPSPFDTLLLLMNGIGIVGDLHGLNTFLSLAKQWLNPGGQIILDSSDVSYLYEQTEVEVAIPNRYRGIIQFRMAYQQTQGESFHWLYIDYPRLVKHAALAGFTCEQLMEGPHYEYLARLSLNS